MTVKELRLALELLGPQGESLTIVTYNEECDRGLSDGYCEAHEVSVVIRNNTITEEKEKVVEIR